MALAAVLGALAGAASFLPLVGATRLVRKRHPQEGLGQAGYLLGGVALSLVVLIATALICIAAFRAYALPFVLAEALALIVVAVVFGLVQVVRKGKKE